MRLEQVPKHKSVHAAAIIIGDRPLDELFPMTYYNKWDQMIVATEGKNAEYLGAMKIDILGVSALEKIYQVSQMVNYKKKEAPVGLDEDRYINSIASSI